MAGLREIGLKFVDIIVKSDNEPALTSLIEIWSNLRAMNGGSRKIVEKHGQNGSGIKGHGEGRFGPKTNEGAHGQSSRDRRSDRYRRL